ncbi:alpha/beta fold hydrolase [Pseudoxanthomonas wuyuanensis]
MDEVIALDGGRSFGLLTRATENRRRRAVVLFNPGLIHRTGAFRFHVRLARGLATRGFDVFRFDLPNTGDAPTGTHATKESVVDEVFDAIEARTGSRHFIVGGICSAADLGWKIALVDKRVVGLLLLDAMAVKNHWFRVGQLRLMLKRPLSSWPGMIVRFLRPKPAGLPGIMDFRDWPEPQQFKRQLAQLLERGVDTLAFYTGGVSYYLLHPRQLRTSYGAWRDHPRLQLEFWPEIDHILFSPLDRERVSGRIMQWMEGL